MGTHERRFHGIVASAMVFLCLVSDLVASPVRAESPGAASIPAGTVIDAKNVSSFGDLGGPGLRWIVDRGVTLKVAPYRKVTNPLPFVEATKKYSSQVKLSPDGKSVVDHVAGLPFPQIDPGDPQVAIKLMFDFESAVARDDLDLRNFECHARLLGAEKLEEKHYLVDHLRRLFFRERTVVPPIPEISPNRDGARYKEMLGPMIEPFQQKGVSWVTYRYIDRSRQDDTWIYLPTLRRVRRIAMSQRSEPFEGQDIDQDSYAGFSANVPWFAWRYLGEKTILSAFHDGSIPVTWSEAPGDFVHAGTWEPRRVWIVEGTPAIPSPWAGSSQALVYAYSKRIVYIDQDTFRIAYSDLYDRAGQLWKVWLTSHLFATAPIAAAKARFDYEVPFAPSMTMIDMQRPSATSCELPSRRFPDEDGWYVNVGDKEGTVESWFDFSWMFSPGR